MYVRKNIPFSILLSFALKPLIIFTLLAISVVIGHMFLNIRHFAIPFLPIGTLGTAVAILLGFRNHSAYDRFWEARKIWGQLVNDSRSFSRSVLTHLDTSDPAVKKRLIYRHIAFVNALRMHLRRQDVKNSNCWNELRNFMEDDEFIEMHHSPNKPTYLVYCQGVELKKVFDSGRIDEFRYIHLNEILDRLYDVQGKCERIKNTPLPRQYAFFTTLFTRIFVFLLPFGFVEQLEWYTIPLSVLISWIFNTLEQVGTYTENPFDNGINDIPMTSLSITIERDLRSLLGEKELPESISPIDGILM